MGPGIRRAGRAIVGFSTSPRKVAPRVPARYGEGRKDHLTSFGGLAALSLDALSSVAYGPEAMLLVLAAAGSSALHLSLPIALAIAALLAVLVVSYCQVIAVHPDGGGAYAVGKQDLGATVSLLAGASLVVDYVLTVAVSLAAGAASLASAFPVPDLAPAGGVPRRAGPADGRQPVGHRREREVPDAPDGGVRRRDRRGHRRRDRPPASGRGGRRRATAARHRGAGCPADPQGLRRGLLRADRGRGDRQRRPVVPRAEGPTRPTHRTDARRAARSDADRPRGADRARTHRRARG